MLQGTTKKDLKEKLSELEKKNALLLDKLKTVGVHDVSEDADRQSIQEKLGSCQWEMAYLKRKIMQLELNNKKNKFISYRLLTTGQEKSVELTEEWEADPSQNKISCSSPLGRALTNKKVGEVSEVQTENGNYAIQITVIR